MLLQGEEVSHTHLEYPESYLNNFKAVSDYARWIEMSKEEAPLCYYPGMNKILMYEEFIK